MSSEGIELRSLGGCLRKDKKTRVNRDTVAEREMREPSELGADRLAAMALRLGAVLVSQGK
jgi:hypothetical protein